MDMALEIGQYVAFGMLISMLIGLAILAIAWHWLPQKVKDELTSENVEGIGFVIIFPMGS